MGRGRYTHRGGDRGRRRARPRRGPAGGPGIPGRPREGPPQHGAADRRRTVGTRPALPAQGRRHRGPGGLRDRREPGSGRNRCRRHAAAPRDRHPGHRLRPEGELGDRPRGRLPSRARRHRRLGERLRQRDRRPLRRLRARGLGPHQPLLLHGLAGHAEGLLPERRIRPGHVRRLQPVRAVQHRHPPLRRRRLQRRWRGRRGRRLQRRRRPRPTLQLTGIGPAVRDLRHPPRRPHRPHPVEQAASGHRRLPAGAGRQARRRRPHRTRLGEQPGRHPGRQPQFAGGLHLRAGQGRRAQRPHGLELQHQGALGPLGRRRDPERQPHRRLLGRHPHGSGQPASSRGPRPRPGRGHRARHHRHQDPRLPPDAASGPGHRKGPGRGAERPPGRGPLGPDRDRHGRGAHRTRVPRGNHPRGLPGGRGRPRPAGPLRRRRAGDQRRPDGRPGHRLRLGRARRHRVVPHHRLHRRRRRRPRHRARRGHPRQRRGRRLPSTPSSSASTPAPAAPTGTRTGRSAETDSPRTEAVCSRSASTRPPTPSTRNAERPARRCRCSATSTPPSRWT